MFRNFVFKYNFYRFLAYFKNESLIVVYALNSTSKRLLLNSVFNYFFTTFKISFE